MKGLILLIVTFLSVTLQGFPIFNSNYNELDKEEYGLFNVQNMNSNFNDKSSFDVEIETESFGAPLGDGTILLLASVFCYSSIKRKNKE